MSATILMTNWFARYFVHMSGDALSAEEARQLADADILAAIEAWSDSSTVVLTSAVLSDPVGVALAGDTP